MFAFNCFLQQDNYAVVVKKKQDDKITRLAKRARSTPVVYSAGSAEKGVQFPSGPQSWRRKNLCHQKIIPRVPRRK